MTKPTNVNTKTGRITGVIRLDRDLTDDEISRFGVMCYQLTGDYFYIVHDKDVDDDGTLKTKHLHFVIECKNRKLLSTWLNVIADTLGLPSTTGIMIQKTTAFVGSVQYLTHQNYPEKQAYLPEKIKTNVKPEQLETILNMSRSGIDIDYLIYVVQTSIDIVDVMKQLGLNYYHIYRATINDLWKHYKGS